MTEANNLSSSNDQGGSVIDAGPGNPNNLGDGSTGQPKGNEPDYKNLYEELEKKLGSQGEELGEYRTFFEGVAPLLDTLDKSPELVQAIINGQIDENIAKAAIEGKISVGDAKTITQAHSEVKKELGNKEYAKATPDEVAKMVEDRVSKVEAKFKEDLKGVEDARVFEQAVNEFIANTPDFTDYAQAVETWLDDHKDVTDIKVAYYAVKGELSEAEAGKRAEEEKAEYEKNVALNAGSGAGGISNIPEGTNAIDILVAGRSNPNIF